MTSAALSILNWKMLTGHALDLLLEITVATHTELQLCLRSNALVVTGMWVMTGQTFPLFIGYMNGRRLLFKKCLLMTGRTKFFTLSFQHQSIVGTVTKMAGGALPSLHRCVDIGFQKLSFQAGMAGVTNSIRSPGQESFGIGAVRIMAAVAHILCERTVLVLIFFTLFARICMTFVAEIPFGLIHQAWKSRRMGGVTRQTSLFTLNRSMGETHPVTGVLMTLEAEVVAITEQQGFLLRGMGVVTGKAVARLKRFMLHCSIALHVSAFMAPATELFRRSIQSKGLFP